jgi:hypothetical protein
MIYDSALKSTRKLKTQSVTRSVSASVLPDRLLNSC